MKEWTDTVTSEAGGGVKHLTSRTGDSVAKTVAAISRQGEGSLPQFAQIVNDCEPGLPVALLRRSCYGRFVWFRHSSTAPAHWSVSPPQPSKPWTTCTGGSLDLCSRFPKLTHLLPHLEDKPAGDGAEAWYWEAYASCTYKIAWQGSNGKENIWRTKAEQLAWICEGDRKYMQVFGYWECKLFTHVQKGVKEADY